MQLRDAQTSELIAEGSAEEIARIAAGFSTGDVLFDDVGSVDAGGVSLFNPVAVRDASDAEITALEAAAAGPGNGAKTELRALVKSRKDRKAAQEARLPEVKERMRVARARMRSRP